MLKLKSIVNSATISLLFVLLASPSFAKMPENVGRGLSGKPLAAVTSKLRSCQARETSVKTRMTQLTKLVTTMETTFDKIATKVENYYTNTVLPSGKSVSNYSVLVSDISTKKSLVQTELDKAKADIAAFNCNAIDPKVFLNQFRTNMQAVKNALKNYRTSVKNLIVAVRTVSKDLEPTPTPSI